MFANGMFQIDPNSTPEQVAQKRALIASLMPQYGKAKYVGEGLGQLFQGIGSGIQNRKLDKIEGAGTASAKDQFSRLFGGPPAQPSGPLSVLGMDPGYGSTSSGANAPMAPVDPSNPDATASDAMTAIGKGGTPDGIRSGLIARGLPEHIADAFIMNFKDESGLNPGINEANPTVPGSRGGFGLAQWTGPRRKALEAFAAQKGMPVSDAGVQMDFLMAELQGPESAAWSKISSSSSKGDAAAAIVNNFLRPAEQHRASREARYLSADGAAPAAPSAPGVPINELYMALQNPWMSKEQQALVTTMIAEQQQASDPMRQMQLEKGALELEQMRNPQADPMSQIELQKAQLELEQMQNGQGANLPSDVQALQYRAQAAGLQPGTPEYQSFMLNGGGDPATYRALEMQALAAGYQKGTPEFAEFMGTRGAGVTEFAKVTGGNTADTQTGGAAAAAIAQGTIQGQTAGNAQAQLSNNLAQADQAVALIDSIISDPALPGITGMLQGRVPPLTQGGTDLGVKIDQLQGKAFLEAFDSLKGGGAISEREGQAATAAMARLNRAQSTEAYVTALDEIKNIMRLGAERARAKAGGGAPMAAPVASPGAPAGAPQPGMTEDGYQFQGGDPADPANWVKVQ